VVQRARLDQRQRDGLPAVVVGAEPAGFGKTTLLAKWLAGDDERTTRTARLSLDRPRPSPLCRCSRAVRTFVKGNGTIILTDGRLVFRKLSGGLVEVPTPMIGEVRQSNGFRCSRVGGATHSS
jgi:hypothetical protein